MATQLWPGPPPGAPPGKAQADDDDASKPEERQHHESAVVDGHLYLWGGKLPDRNVKQSPSAKLLDRKRIWEMNLRVEPPKRKWGSPNSTLGRTIPPCEGARCVVIDKMIYSYGGEDEDGSYLGIVYRLDPKKMEWIEVSAKGNTPASRTQCCLCVIGSRVIMFGGKVKSGALLQSGATADDEKWTNEIYEFELQEGCETGMWLNLELSGTRPKPLERPAMAPIDQHRAFLHGVDSKNKKSLSFVLDLQKKSWNIIDFDVTLSPRWTNAICQLVIKGLEEKALCLLIATTYPPSFHVLDIDKSKAYEMNIEKKFKSRCGCTVHCVPSEDGTIEVIVCHQGIRNFCLGSKNPSFMKIERELRLSMTQSLRKELDDAQRSLKNKNEENSALREKLERLEVERSHVSTKTERRRNDEETNSPINRFLLILQPYYVPFLLLSISICLAVYIGYSKTSSPTNSSSVSLYTAPWNNFSRIVCEAGLDKWEDIGDLLGFDVESLQAIRKREQGSKNQCRFLLTKYVEGNGESREGRDKVVKACLDVHIGGRLKDIVKDNGYSI